MEGRWRGDGGEVQGRCRGDAHLQHPLRRKGDEDGTLLNELLVELDVEGHREIDREVAQCISLREGGIRVI